MTDFFRGGSFGSPGLTGPFRTNSGGFGQYQIGGTGQETAYLDKLEAQIAWQNGRMGDDAYVAALRTYLGSTEANTSERARAQDELDDTIFSIARNKAVQRVNGAPAGNARINALNALMALDRRRLRGMQPGNEAYREQQALVTDLRIKIRSEQWGAIVRRYNEGRATNAEMQVAAARFARASAGQLDEQEYRDLVRDFEGRVLDEQLADAITAWNEKQSRGNAGRVNAIYAQMRGRVDADSPDGRSLARRQREFADAVEASEDALELARMESRRASGNVDDGEWLSFLRRRIKSEDRGTVEYISRRDRFLNESFASVQRNLTRNVELGEAPVSDLIDFYGSALATMDPDSPSAYDMRAEISRLRSTGIEALSIAQPAGMGGYQAQPFEGHMVSPGRDGSGDGFISQFDGSAFAGANCGMASAAMLAWAVSGGKVRISGGQMRYYSGDRDGGTWVDDMVRGMGVVGLGAKAYTGMSYQSFRKKVANGQPAVLTGTSGMLPPGLQMGYQGAHSVYVDHMTKHDGKVWYWVMDPLGRAGYGGAWWPEEALFAFSWKGTAQGTQGSAVFAGRSGSAKRVGQLPPFQAFDTDYLGRSTVGRGGGTNRAEAGARRDWSKGKPTKPKGERNGSDDDMVADFLAAVEAIEQRQGVEPYDPSAVMPGDEGDGDVAGTSMARSDRARTLLERNNGDPRLAAIEWFTGMQPSSDPSEWSRNDLWYANAVGRRTGYKKVTRSGGQAVGDTPDTPEPNPVQVAYDPLSSVQEPRQEATGLPPNLDEMARGILLRLGVVPNAQQVRTIAAWISAENGGQDVQGNNPLRLMTMGDTDLTGQFGKAEDGTAAFGSLADGLEAAADEIMAKAPQLVGAVRSNDPEAFFRALGGSKWTDREDYARAGVAAYNTLPGTTPLIANIGTKAFEAPVSLAQATRTMPDLAELLDVDPSDPNQMAWFTRNMESARQAALTGKETWTYETPGGETMEVENAGAVARDILRVNLDYSVAIAPPTQAGWQTIRDAEQAYFEQLTDIDYEAADRFMEDGFRFRDKMLASGDLGAAWNIEQDMAMMLNAIGGSDQLATPDASLNPFLSDDQRSRVVGWIERLEAWDPLENQGGSQLLAMQKEGELHVTPEMAGPGGPMVPHPTGRAVNVVLTGEAFFTQDPITGEVTAVRASTDPDMFAPVEELDANTGQWQTVPYYRSSQAGLVHIVAPGIDVWQRVEEVAGTQVAFYERKFEGRDKQLAERQQQAAGGMGAPSVPGLAGMTVHGGELGAGIAAALTAWAQSSVPESAGPGTAPDMASSSVVQVGRHEFPILQMRYRDPESDQMMTWFSLDGLEWLGRVDTGLDGKAPGLVVTQGSGAAFKVGEDGNVQLHVNGQPYDPSAPNAPKLGSLVHWFGTQPGDLAAGEPSTSMGAPGGDYLHRSLVPVTGDGTRIEGAALDGTLRTGEKIRSGLLTGPQAAAAVIGDLGKQAAATISSTIEDIRRGFADVAGRAVGPILGPGQGAAAVARQPWSAVLPMTSARISQAVQATVASATEQRQQATAALAAAEQAQIRERQRAADAQAARLAAERAGQVAPSPAPSAPRAPSQPTVQPRPQTQTRPRQTTAPAPKPVQQREGGGNWYSGPTPTPR